LKPTTHLLVWTWDFKKERG